MAKGDIPLPTETHRDPRLPKPAPAPSPHDGLNLLNPLAPFNKISAVLGKAAAPKK
jgi:hypothetical protein